MELKTKSGYITVPIVDEDGTKLGKFRFNPADPNLLKRLEKGAKALDELEFPEEMGMDEMMKANDLIKEQFDFILGKKASDSIFGICAPLSIDDDGNWFFENILDGIADIITKAAQERYAKKMERIKAATAEYLEEKADNPADSK